MLRHQLQDVYTRIIRPLVVISHLKTRTWRRELCLQRFHISVDPSLEHITFKPDIVRERRAERHLAQCLRNLVAAIISAAGTRGYAHKDSPVFLVVQLSIGLVRAGANLEDLPDTDFAAFDTHELDV